MQSTTIRTITDAARRDYTYWRSVTDASSGTEPNTTIAFYAKFWEGISNGLNAIYRYHHPEEYVGRFLDRKHIFAVREEEFEALAEELVEDMLATGNSPVLQLDSDKAVSFIIAKLKRWYYILDRLDGKTFQQRREAIFDVLAYDITTVFHPGNLDFALLDAYRHQFSLSENKFAVITQLTRQTGLPDDFRWYLGFRSEFPEGLDHIVDDTASLHKASLTTLAKTMAGLKGLKDQALTIPKPVIEAAREFDTYYQGYRALYAILARYGLPTNDDQLMKAAQEAATAVNKLPNYPTHAFDEASFAMYMAEKWKRWRLAYDDRHKTVQLAIIAHDTLRFFFQHQLEEYFLETAERSQSTFDGAITVISGWALKYSDKCIRYMVFKDGFPDWDNQFDAAHADTLVPKLRQAIDRVYGAYATVKKIPKNRYVPMMKGFTSFFTLKKVVEVYYEQDEEVGSVDERVDELYKTFYKKDEEEKDTSAKLEGLEKLLTKQPKRLSEDQFDEALYLLMRSGLAAREESDFGAFLEDDKMREKYQQLVYIRFDSYTFNRIMATNSGGLANLFGTKGFIILIEAYLVGTGIEHFINHFVVGSFQSVYNLFANPFIDPISPHLNEAMITTYDFSWEAFGQGWDKLDWSKTSLSLIIPIFLMFLITAYNYAFYKLRRSENRSKSFRHLAATTKRWLEKTKYTINFHRRKEFNVMFEAFKAALLIIETYYIIKWLYDWGFEPVQLGLFFFLLSTICLSAYQGNKLKDEVTLGQSEAISDSIRDFIFIPIIELGRILSGSAKSINFIPWLVRTGVEPLYRTVIIVLRSFISFQREKKDEIV